MTAPRTAIQRRAEDAYGNPFPALAADEPGAPGATSPAPGAPGTLPPAPGAPGVPSAAPTVPPVTPPGTPGGIQGTGTVQGVGGTGTVMVPPPPPPNAQPGWSGAPGTGLNGQPVPPPPPPASPAPAAPAPAPAPPASGPRPPRFPVDNGGPTGMPPAGGPPDDPRLPGGPTAPTEMPAPGGGVVPPPTAPAPAPSPSPTTPTAPTGPTVAVPTAPTGTRTLPAPSTRPTFTGYRAVAATPSQDWRKAADAAVGRFTDANTPEFEAVAEGDPKDDPFDIRKAAKDVLDGPDRLALAQQALQLFGEEQASQARSDTSAILDRAASAGRLGMGATGEQVDRLNRSMARDRAVLENQLARDFANVSVSDRINRLGALSGVDAQEFGQGLTTRNEARGERASEFEQALARAGLLGQQAQTAQQFGQQSFLNDAALRGEARGEQDRARDWQATDFDAQMRRAALEEALTSGDWNRYLAAATAARGQNIFSGFANPFNTGA